jgi:hypothetical protein
MIKSIFAFALLVGMIACTNAPEQKAETATTGSTTPTTETTCYLFTLQKDSSAVQITIEGNNVTGYYDWRPWEKDGAHGSLTGKKSGDMITADYKYMIEGSIQTEEVIFKMGADNLTKMEGELEEKNGKLVLKDPAKAQAGDVLKKIDCTLIEANIGYAKSALDMMK